MSILNRLNLCFLRGYPTAQWRRSTKTAFDCTWYTSFAIWGTSGCGAVIQVSDCSLNNGSVMKMSSFGAFANTGAVSMCPLYVNRRWNLMLVTTKIAPLVHFFLEFWLFFILRTSQYILNVGYFIKIHFWRCII